MLSIMKSLLVVTLLPCFLASCSAPPHVGPMPDARPAAVSNTATRAELKATRSRIKVAKAHAAQGATALEKAGNLITQMLKEK